jgi:hypothetical protein
MILSAFTIAALVLAIVDVTRAKGQSILSWAVILLCLALLMPAMQW